MKRAAAGDPRAQETVVWRYRAPVLRFLGKRLPPSVDAEQVANDVMFAMLDREFLGSADQAKGRFRDLLLAMTRHLMYNASRKERAAKRGGGRIRVSLEDLGADPPTTVEERLDFAHLFAKEVIAGAQELHLAEAKERGSLEAEALYRGLLHGRTQKEIAAELGITVDAVNNHQHRGRETLRRLVQEVLATTCSTREELEEELRLLMSALGGEGR